MFNFLAGARCPILNLPVDSLAIDFRLVGDNPMSAPNSIVEFTCKKGYKLREGGFTKPLVCLANGRWSSDIPVCVPGKCTGIIILYLYASLFHRAICIYRSR